MCDLLKLGFTGKSLWPASPPPCPDCDTHTRHPIESFTEAIEYIAAKKATALNVWDHF